MNPEHLRHLGRPIRPAGECPDCDHQRDQMPGFEQPSASRCRECDGTEGHYIDCSLLGV